MASVLDPDTIWTGNLPDAGSSPISYGAPAYSGAFALADAGGLELLYGSVPHLSFFCSLTTTPTPLQILAPPFANRAQVLAMGSGDGSVSVGSYSIPIDGGDGATNASDAQLWAGPAEVADLLAFTFTNAGVPELQSFNVSKSGNCSCWGLVFRFTRSAAAL